jgi:hypothetical protein
MTLVDRLPGLSPGVSPTRREAKHTPLDGQRVKTRNIRSERLFSSGAE